MNGSAPEPRACPPGVNLVGYFNAELGVGEVARQAIRALDATGIPVLPLHVTAHASRQGHPYDAVRGLHNPLPVNLLCVNADQTPPFALEAGPRFFEDKYTIGWWWWEVSEFPAMWTASFEHVDELWAGSRFVADTLAAVSPVPVLHIPMPVAAPAAAPGDRAALGLPEGFVFLFAFDFHSVFDRKNPLGLVEAFRRAFPTPRAGVTLALKSINHDAHRRQHARLKAAISDRPDVVLIDRYLPTGEKDGLLATCDCYVSLHRSEGFGITLAEAMLLGKPVIATQYSGSADVIRADTAFPVSHALVPIGRDRSPYPADGMWADPDLDEAAAHMRTVVEKPEVAAQRAAAGRRYVAQRHSPHAAGAVMRRRLEHLMSRELPDPAEELSARTRADTLHVIRRGPVRWPHGGRNPRKYLRALALRAAKPVLAYQREVNEALAWSDTQTERAAMALAAQQAASALAAGRRLHEHVEHAVANLRRGAPPRLEAPRRHVGVAERPGAGRVLVLDGPAPPVSESTLGSVEQVRDRLRPLLGVLDRGPVADLTPLRGELIALLADQGVEAVAADGDPVAFLDGGDDLGTVFSLVLAERLDDADLRRLLRAARGSVRIGGRLVLAAENPQAPGADARFWLDPARVRPLPAVALLQAVVDAGFGDAYAYCPAGTGDWERDVLVEASYAVVAER